MGAQKNSRLDPSSTPTSRHGKTAWLPLQRPQYNNFISNDEIEPNRGMKQGQAARDRTLDLHQSDSVLLYFTGWHSREIEPFNLPI